jgi:hypothetical protein
VRSLIFYAVLGAVLVAVASFQDRESSSDPTSPAPGERIELLAAARPESRPVRDEPTAPLDRVESESAARMHEESVLDFALRSGFGLARMIAPIEAPEPFQIDGKDRVVARQRLIGAWVHDEPRLYSLAVLDNHKSTTHHAEWSPLDATDRAALDELAEGAELVASRDRSWLFGALRANRACVECHEVAPGTLLGAFRYDLAEQAGPRLTSLRGGPPTGPEPPRVR